MGLSLVTPFTWWQETSSYEATLLGASVVPALRLCLPTPLVAVSGDGPLPEWRPSPRSDRSLCAWGCGSSVSPTQTSCFPRTWGEWQTERVQAESGVLSPSHNCCSLATAPSQHLKRPLLPEPQHSPQARLLTPKHLFFANPCSPIKYLTTKRRPRKPFIPSSGTYVRKTRT